MRSLFIIGTAIEVLAAVQGVRYYRANPAG